MPLKNGYRRSWQIFERRPEKEVYFSNKNALNNKKRAPFHASQIVEHALVPLFLVMWIFQVSAPALAQLGPHKDRLFQYPGILEQSFGGDYVQVDYLKGRDIWVRDEIPERRVKSKYVRRVGFQQKSLTFSAEGRDLDYFSVGKRKNARVIVIYLHGRNGSRHQGVNDYTFGGNFNRIKNLMVRNGGLYVSPDFTDFGATGASDIKALIALIRQDNPAAPVMIACGSMGGSLCWRLAKDPAVAPALGGILLLGSLYDDGYFTSPGARSRSKALPIYIGHGTWDDVFKWQEREAFFRRVKSRNAQYPIRLALFDTGTHGTPIRMTDWRLTLNWMLRAGS